MYRVKSKLPLPFAPLQEGHPEPQPKPLSAESLGPADFANEDEALERARELIKLGYGVSFIDPNGREWPHDMLLRRLAD